MSAETPRHEYVVLLDRIIAAAVAGDPADLANIYAPDAVIWHNTDNRETTVEQNMKALVAMDRFLTDREYADRRMQIFEGGIVQQHVLRGKKRSTGEPAELKACVVVSIKDGRITRLDEYFDSAEAAALRA